MNVGHPNPAAVVVVVVDAAAGVSINYIHINIFTQLDPLALVECEFGHANYGITIHSSPLVEQKTAQAIDVLCRHRSIQSGFSNSNIIY